LVQFLLLLDMWYGPSLDLMYMLILGATPFLRSDVYVVWVWTLSQI